MANLATAWFALADADRDGKISGPEAVTFFMRSGLPKDVLGQIWELASGGAPALYQPQFNTAMRLVALAQVNMGRLPPDHARAIAAGAGPQVPIPRMAGLDAPGAPPLPGAPGYTLQVTGAPPPPLPGGGRPGFPPQLTGGYGPQLTGGAPGYTPHATGGAPPGYLAPPPGAPPPGAAPRPPLPGGGGPPGYLPQPTGGWPPVSAEDMSRYRAEFGQLDRDGDGLVQGADCFGVFMRTGLEKRTLKHIWDVVAGASGALNAEQFVRASYLMDRAKAGAPPPPALPPGAWPPLAPGVSMPPLTSAAATAGGATGSGAVAGVAGAAAALAAAGVTGSLSGSGSAAGGKAWTLESQFGSKTAARAVSEVYDQTLPRLPGMPQKVVYDAAGRPVAAGGASDVPDLEGEVAQMLGGDDKARFAGARGEALKREEELRQAEADAAAAKQRLKVFQDALAEVMLFKSRADVALLQATDLAQRTEVEASETERRYHGAYLAAQGQFAASEEARKELQAALAKKQEASNKLLLLQQELAMLANMNPQEMAALQAEVAALIAAVSEAESKKAGLELQLDAGRKQRGLLEARASDLELSSAASEAELGRVTKELAALRARVGALAGAPVAGAGAGGGGLELGDLSDALVAAAGAYRSLFSALQGRGADVPYEASLNNVGALVWVDTLLAGTADWIDADTPGDDAGYTVVNALPELDGVPPALLKAAGGAAARQGPLKRGAAPALAAPAGGAAGGPAAASAGAPAAAGGDEQPAGVAAAAADAVAEGTRTGAEAAAAGKARATAGPAVAAVTAAVAGVAAVQDEAAGTAAAAAADQQPALAAPVRPAADAPAAAAAAAAAPAVARGASDGPSAAPAVAAMRGPAAAVAAGAAAEPVAAGVTGSSVLSGAAAAGHAPFIRSETGDSGTLEAHNPFSSVDAPPTWAAFGGGGAPRASNATDSSAFEDDAFR